MHANPMQYYKAHFVKLLTSTNSQVWDLVRGYQVHSVISFDFEQIDMSNVDK